MQENFLIGFQGLHDMLYKEVITKLSVKNQSYMKPRGERLKM